MFSSLNKKIPLLIILLFASIYCQSKTDNNSSDKNEINNNKLIEIANSEQLWTGVAVSHEGRIFVNFPRWGVPIDLSVAELSHTGELRPYPNNKWNTWSEGISPKNHFYCVQSVYIDNKNYLWILDSGNPGLTGIVKNAAKLLKINLHNNNIVKTYRFKKSILHNSSYLNDVRIDTDNNFAYITDSGIGAIIVINLSTGETRKVLNNHNSTKAEDIIINVEDNIDLSIKIHSDGLAISPNNRYIYYQALSSRKLFRINTEILRDFTTINSQIESAVEFMCSSGVTDGIAFDDNGYLYFTSIEKNAISRWLPPNGDMEILVTKSKIKWPDSISITTDLDLYFTTSQLHLGTSRKDPYRLFKIKL